MARHGRGYPIRPIIHQTLYAEPNIPPPPGLIGTFLTWVAPTTLANGDPLPGAAITGYRIWMGPSAGALVAVLDVGPSPTEVLFSSIPGSAIGQWFAVSALNILGESGQTIAAQWISAGMILPTGTLSGVRFGWIVPTLLPNGNPLPPENITGYRIYRGLTAETLAAVLDIGPTPLELPFASIPGALVGHWFAVSALSTLGLSAQTQTMQWVTRSTIVTW